MKLCMCNKKEQDNEKDLCVIFLLTNTKNLRLKCFGHVNHTKLKNLQDGFENIMDGTRLLR